MLTRPADEVVQIDAGKIRRQLFLQLPERRMKAAVTAVAFAVRAHKPLVQAVAEHIFPVHDLNQIHQRNIMQILHQPAAALGSADNFDVSGPFHFLGNFICKLPRYELFIADFPDVFQPQVN